MQVIPEGPEMEATSNPNPNPNPPQLKRFYIINTHDGLVIKNLLRFFFRYRFSPIASSLVQFLALQK